MLIAMGAVLIILGLLFHFGWSLPMVGRLPGDIVIRRNGLTIFLPLGTSVLLSILLTLLFRFWGR